MPPTLKIDNGFLSVQVQSASAKFQFFAPGIVYTQTHGEEGVVDIRGPIGVGARSFGSHWGGTIGAGYAQVPGHVWQKIWWAGNLACSGTVTLQQSMASPITLVRKFKLSGTLKGYLINPFIDVSPAVVDVNLKGGGLAVIELTSIVIPSGERVFDLQSLTYNMIP